MTSYEQSKDDALSDLRPAEGARTVEELAARHGISQNAVKAMMSAMTAGGGGQAQFNHPELGGLGQWSRGGMLMIGDMFNHALKAKVAALAEDVAALVASQPDKMSSDTLSSRSMGHTESRWPEALGTPSSSGSQNGMRYAVFADARRLAVDVGGHITVYDTADHRITGLGQQQGSGQSLSVTSQTGAISLDSLTMVPC